MVEPILDVTATLIAFEVICTFGRRGSIRGVLTASPLPSVSGIGSSDIRFDADERIESASASVYKCEVFGGIYSDEFGVFDMIGSGSAKSPLTFKIRLKRGSNVFSWLGILRRNSL